MREFGKEWDILLDEEREKSYFRELEQFLAKEYCERTIYPSEYDLFNALHYTSYSSVRVVILGQDPYHGEGQAHGLCFSVKRGIEPPPSLKNICREIESDLGIFYKGDSGELCSWARQGVLLLNTVMTVRKGEPASHKGKGWEQFTDEIIRLLNLREDPMVFMLWGGHARSKVGLITNPMHLVLTAAHPSPLSASRGFLGCKHFSQANAFLEQHGFTPIDWSVR